MDTQLLIETHKLLSEVNEKLNKILSPTPKPNKKRKRETKKHFSESIKKKYAIKNILKK